MAEYVRASQEPQDRLTRICDTMTTTFDMHPESRDTDRCMVFLDDGDTGGLVLHGYEDQGEALANLFMHLKAMFRSMGKDLDLMFLGDDGVDRV